MKKSFMDYLESTEETNTDVDKAIKYIEKEGIQNEFYLFIADEEDIDGLQNLYKKDKKACIEKIFKDYKIGFSDLKQSVEDSK